MCEEDSIITSTLHNGQQSCVCESPRRVRRVGVGPSFDVMFEAASLLNSEAGFAASLRSSMQDQFAIPLHRPENRKQWAYLDSTSRRMRRVWAFNIEYNRTHYCFIDYEMRKRGEKAAGLVRLSTGKKLSDVDFQMVLHGISSSEGNWNGPFFVQHGVITTKCPHTWATARQCAQTVKCLLVDLV